MTLAITDHALLRLVERGVGGEIVLALKNELSARLERAAATAERLGQGNYHITLDGLRFVVKDGAVITVMDGDSTHAARKNGIARA